MSNNVYDLSNKIERAAFLEKVAALSDAGKYVELKEKRPTRSLLQNRYLYRLLGWFGLSFGLSAEDVKEQIFKRTCNPQIFVRRKTIKVKGKTIANRRIHVRSTTELDTAEMAEAITRFRNWSAINAGLYLPAPDESDSLAYIGREIERAKEYL